MDHGLRCWKCGASLADYTLPLRRLEECRACNAELHVCRMCEFYDTTVARHCRETIAEEVKDRTRANFCDYFRYRTAGEGAGEPGDKAAGGAGSGERTRDEARRKLDKLFGA